MKSTEPSASSAEPGFSVSLGDFSGPLDLLCHLVESRAMDAAKVKLTDVLSQYVSYMLTARKATLSELAEFFSLASRLLLRKVRSLMPNQGEDEGEPLLAGDVGDELDEDTLAALLERFRPYREAAFRLASLKEERERCFLRMSEDVGTPWYDLDDLYSLASLWWRLIAERQRRRESETERGFMMEIPDAVPEEILVERRMSEVRDVLLEERSSTLSALLRRFGENSLIVTLLALLELSRLGMIDLEQGESWGDVEVVGA